MTEHTVPVRWLDEQCGEPPHDHRLESQAAVMTKTTNNDPVRVRKSRMVMYRSTILCVTALVAILGTEQCRAQNVGLAFDGVDDYALNLAMLGYMQHTYEVIGRKSRPQTGPSLVSFASQSHGAGICDHGSEFGVAPEAPILKYNVDIPGCSNDNLTSAGSDYAWHHYAATFDASEQRIYLTFRGMARHVFPAPADVHSVARPGTPAASAAA